MFDSFDIRTRASPYVIRFGRELTPGRWVSEEEIRCTTPAHAATTVVVEISPEPGKPFTNDKVGIKAESGVGSLF